ncbi:MAG: hypothetical protein ICV66_00155 [Chitinophagaceae bacterium]|nr:hypothetical protein [Chitinophagaceae bacterium]
MFRRYTIHIEIKEGAVENKKDMLEILGCSISEPSNWVEYGSTRERGLTFLDKNGNELQSFVFQHQPYFNSLREKTGSEENEIKEFIYAALSEHYHIDPADVNIIVSEYDRL